jgi:[acyl-carrier-protein] S-malonyltransferase
MSKKIAFLFPGQGAQYPGMAKDFYEQFSIARETFEEADDLLSFPYSKWILEGPAEELTLTKNSQVGIYIASFAILRCVQQQFSELQPTVCAGLSLGEYTALAAAGKMTFADGLVLVQARGRYMQEACEEMPGTMQVVLGLDEASVEKIIDPIENVWVANLNCPGQVVIAGTLAGINAAALALKEQGAKRVLPLEVSGAFHSGLMAPAKEKLSPKIASVPLTESTTELVMNVPGDYVSALDEIRNNLILQVTSPVRWEKGIRAMMERGIDLYIEMGCGKTLSGMNKKIGVTSKTCSIEKIADLEGFYAAIER